MPIHIIRIINYTMGAADATVYVLDSLAISRLRDSVTIVNSRPRVDIRDLGNLSHTCGVFLTNLVGSLNLWLRSNPLVQSV